MTRYAGVYWAQFKAQLISNMQYRVALLLWLLTMAVEPVIYLVVWQIVATQQGGSVAGYTAGDFAAYYIVWTLVRQMNIALTPYEFEERILRGTLSPMLLRPMHLYHLDLAGFFSFKAVTLFLWIPIGVGLTLAFRPDLHPTGWQAAAFAVAIVTGFIMRFTLVWALGLATFWIVKVSALFEVYFGLELFLSGRLVPIVLLPLWMQQASRWFPFQWSFGFPIELLLGKLTVEQTLIGFGAQAVWFVIGALLIAILWREGLKRYGAVGA